MATVLESLRASLREAETTNNVNALRSRRFFVAFIEENSDVPEEVGLASEVLSKIDARIHYLENRERQPSGRDVQRIACSACQGTGADPRAKLPAVLGRAAGYLCPECQGRGWVPY